MTAPRSKLNPSHLRDCMTVQDSRLIAAEVRAQSVAVYQAVAEGGNAGRNRLLCVARVLEQTAHAMEDWAMKVSMRRSGPDPTPARDASGDDGAWQSTDFEAKHREAKEKQDAGHLKKA